MPLPVISVEQMREWEKATWASGQTEAEVIRRVGVEVATLALELTGPQELILILAGKGHNGDDARAAREHLSERRVDVLEAADPVQDLSKLSALLSLRPALIIDGLFGIGLNRPLNSSWIQFIQSVNEAQCRVLSVDVPSGLEASTGKPQGAALNAALTLTVGAPKLGMLAASAWDFVGRLEVAREVGLASLSLASELQWTIGKEDFHNFPPRRRVAGHKGTYGHLEIICGSVGYHGAAVLAARAAQKAQPGLISLCTLQEVYSMVASQLQAVMVAPWHPGFAIPDNRTAILIGPGLAATDLPEELKLLVKNLWRDFTGPMIVDASALAWIPQDVQQVPGIRLITPHPGEAARLLETDAEQVQSDRLKAVRELSRRFANTWVVLKGHQTLIGRHAGEVLVNSSGNPHLAQGGSGDVLSGFIAGLLAQPPLQADPLKTLAYAVWQHGATADSLQSRGSNWVIEDLVTHLGESG
jgi:ADP-dependent NAD(P)H-hydrate dehydratase / NAD(P)H-hydrate epimerase